MTIPFTKRDPSYERVRHLRGAIILIEGLIGAGKTTLCEKLSELLHRVGIPVKFFEEEVDEKLLNLFLSDMKKYAFAFQMTMMANRQKVYIAAQDFSHRENGVSIIDRSLFGDYAFASMHRDMGNISDKEWDAYESVLSSAKLTQPSNILYLDVDPEIALERIKARNRGSESTAYTLDYLKELDVSYKVSLEESNIHVQYIDWNTPRSLSDEELIELCEEELDPHA